MSDKLVRLEEWSFVSTDPCVAPELQNPRIRGVVYCHPKNRFTDGTRIVTGDIIDFEGKIFRTKNTTYQLGEPEQAYREWLKERRPDWDPDNPAKYI